MKTWSWYLIGIATLLFLVIVVKAGDDDLIKQLSDRKFSVREKASRRLLEKMDFESYLELRSFYHEDLEVLRRVQTAVSDYEKRIVQKYLVTTKLKLPENISQYPWIYFGGLGWDDSCCWLKTARMLGVPEDGIPEWTDWRTATKIWADTEVVNSISIALDGSMSEGEFFCIMNCTMKRIMDKIKPMVKMQDNYYGGKKKNPLRKVWQCEN